MLCHDNLHLGLVGTFLLTKNFADVFNVADWPLINEIDNDNIEVHQGINVVNDQAQRTLSQVLVKNLKISSCFYINRKKWNHNRLIFSPLSANSVPNKLDDIRITNWVSLFQSLNFSSTGSQSPLGKIEIRK